MYNSNRILTKIIKIMDEVERCKRMLADSEVCSDVYENTNDYLSDAALSLSFAKGEVDDLLESIRLRCEHE